jgi:serine/threonine-protein phosphatase PPG1
VRHFLERNNMSHILRAHQLCMEGFSVLYDDQLSTVWSAPNYCYRCGNMASILEVGPNGTKHFNTFEAAPENERDGPAQAAQPKVSAAGIPRRPALTLMLPPLQPQVEVRLVLHRPAVPPH